MEFSIAKEAILKPLQTVAGVIERRQTLPILSNVLLSLNRQVLSLIGTDLEVEWVARIPLAEPKEVSGEITVPARKLLDIVKALPDGAMLQMSVEKERMIIRAGKGRYALATLPASDYPRLKDGPGSFEFSITQQQLKQLIENTAFAMAQQDVRYYLNGMLWDLSGGGIRAVATDGHRLATHTIPLQLQDKPAKQVILPRKAVLELSRAFTEDEHGDLGVVVGDTHFRAITPRFSFTSKLIDGKFPDYKKVLPSVEGNTACIARDRFKNMLSRVSVLFTDKHRGAHLTIEPGVLKATAKNADQDEVEEEIDIEYSGEVQRIGFNISYILEYLNIVKAPLIKMTFSNPDASVLFEASTEEGGLYVVMPMRL